MKNLHLGPQNGPKVKTAKNSKLLELLENCFEQVGKVGWPPISTWINPPSLGSNGLNCIEFPGKRRNCFLNMNLCDLCALLEKLHCLDF